MSDDGGVVRVISWRDLCPWLIIFRSFRLSISPKVLFLALCGALLTWVGWLISAKVFVGEDGGVDRNLVGYYSTCPCSPPGYATIEVDTHVRRIEGTYQGYVSDPSFPRYELPAIWYYRFVQPFLMLFRTDATPTELAFFLFGGLWTLAVWSYFGGAITRIAALDLGREERVSLKEALSHACRKFLSHFGAPIIALLGVVLAGLFTFFLGFFMLADWGLFIAGIFWIFALLAGFVMMFILLGLLFGWPLMWGTLGAEGSDALDALSRSYSYTFGRPLHYLFYALVASSFGLLCWTLVYLCAETMIDLSYWAASWSANISFGSGGEEVEEGAANISRIQQIMWAAETRDTEELGNGIWLFYAANSLVRALATAFTYSFFFCAVTAIYLLLRRDVDQTEFDEVWVEDDEEHLTLPAMKPDKSGMPELAKDKPAGAESTSSSTEDDREDSPSNDQDESEDK